MPQATFEVGQRGSVGGVVVSTSTSNKRTFGIVQGFGKTQFVETQRGGRELAYVRTSCRAALLHVGDGHHAYARGQGLSHIRGRKPSSSTRQTAPT